MPRCKEISARAADFMENRLAILERLSFALHLASCRDCRRDVAQLKATVRLLGRLPPPPISPPTNDALMRQFRATWPPASQVEAHPVRSRPMGWLLSGALMGVALMLGAFQVRTWGPFPGWHFPCPLIELSMGLGPAIAVLLLMRRGGLSSGKLAVVATSGSFIGMLVINRTCPLAHEASHILPLHVGGVLIALLAGASLPHLSRLRAS